ncbi:hypothetical protein F2P56_016141 [Juglans regia]|uniref:S-protein homolog n=1 Tax=Juglans regia TaxID=51240 RepID=A0A833XHH8_JUGRE|nr:hypothetical protein F2P56_016141 [Juglans regia]
MARVFCMSEAGFLQHKARVRISNDLGEGMDLSVHCVSGEDDLGTHLIPYHSGYYEFGFRPNFQGTTLFHCGFQWNDVSHHFDIYIANRDQKHCTLCLWNIKADHPCMLNEETSKYDLCYDWSP